MKLEQIETERLMLDPIRETDKGDCFIHIKRKILIFSAVLPAVEMVLLFVFLLLYGPNFGIYLRKPRAQDYGERALAFMENGDYSSAEEWREAKATAQDALRTGEAFCEKPIPPDVLTDSPEQEAAAWIRSR